MKNVYFTKTKEGAKKYLDSILGTSYEKAICIYKKGTILLSPELLGCDCEYIEFSEYGSPDHVIQDHSNNIMIVIEPSEMIRPSNRCDIRFEYMYNFGKYKDKFIIDTAPFKQEKWRVWYPYGIVKPNAFDYPHSYAIESAYRSYEEERSDFDLLEIRSLVKDVLDITAIDYRYYFENKFKFVEHKTTVSERNEYERIKEHLFNTKTTVTPILRGLHKYSKSLVKEHNIFRDLKKIYKIKGDITIHMTDLPIDTYLKSEIVRVINETNEMTRRFYDEDIS